MKRRTALTAGLSLFCGCSMVDRSNNQHHTPSPTNTTTTTPTPGNPTPTSIDSEVLQQRNLDNRQSLWHLMPQVSDYMFSMQIDYQTVGIIAEAHDYVFDFPYFSEFAHSDGFSDTNLIGYSRIQPLSYIAYQDVDGKAAQQNLINNADTTIDYRGVPLGDFTHTYDSDGARKIWAEYRTFLPDMDVFIRAATGKESNSAEPALDAMKLALDTILGDSPPVTEAAAGNTPQFSWTDSTPFQDHVILHSSNRAPVRGSNISLNYINTKLDQNDVEDAMDTQVWKPSSGELQQVLYLFDGEEWVPDERTASRLSVAFENVLTNDQTSPAG